MIVNSDHVREKLTGDKVPGKSLESRLYNFKKMLFFYIERTLQNGHLCSFAEKGRGPDPQDSPSCAYVHYHSVEISIETILFDGSIWKCLC